MRFTQRLKPFDKPVFHLILIALLGLIAYSNTFDVPFQWDDQGFIADNPIIKDLNYFLEPSKAKDLEYYDAFKNRYIGYLTFALNYKLHGLDVRGYHVVNIAIHILNAFLVYFLVILTFKTPFLKESALKEKSGYIALFSALLFVSHPIQTEAVTYIFQRLASLAAFFYMLSLVLYIKWRNREHPSTGSGCMVSLSNHALYLLCLLSAVLAMKTKENAFTLPIMIALYEFFFFEGRIKKRLLWLAPLLLTMFIILFTYTGGIAAAIKGYEGIPRWDYFFTQFRVIVTYIRLLFLPVNQNIDYDYPIYSSFFNPQVLLSFVFLSCLAALGVYMFWKSKNKLHLRLFSFGIFWFFITLSVESSVIPLAMVINEYRMYMPSASIFFGIATAVFLLMQNRNDKKKRLMISLMTLLPLIFSYATLTRNDVWKSGISLWEDTARKSPHKARPHYNLGNVYYEKGLTDRAIEQYLIAVKRDSHYAEAHNNLGVAYASKGMTETAIRHFRTAIDADPNCADAHVHLGIAYNSMGLVDEAIRHYQAALRIKPNLLKAHNNIAAAYGTKGLMDETMKHLKAALEVNPNDADANYNLGFAYASKGLFDKAIKHYEAALIIKPNDADTHHNLGIAYQKIGLHTRAEEHLRKAKNLK